MRREAEPTTLGQLLDVCRAQRVLIQDAWVGYSPSTPAPASSPCGVRRSSYRAMIGATSFEPRSPTRSPARRPARSALVDARRVARGGAR